MRYLKKYESDSQFQTDFESNTLPKWFMAFCGDEKHVHFKPEEETDDRWMELMTNAGYGYSRLFGAVQENQWTGPLYYGYVIPSTKGDILIEPTIDGTPLVYDEVISCYICKLEEVEEDFANDTQWNYAYKSPENEIPYESYLANHNYKETIRIDFKGFRLKKEDVDSGEMVPTTELFISEGNRASSIFSYVCRTSKNILKGVTDIGTRLLGSGLLPLFGNIKGSFYTGNDVVTIGNGSFSNMLENNLTSVRVGKNTTFIHPLYYSFTLDNDKPYVLPTLLIDAANPYIKIGSHGNVVSKDDKKLVSIIDPESQYVPYDDYNMLDLSEYEIIGSRCNEMFTSHYVKLGMNLKKLESFSLSQDIVHKIIYKGVEYTNEFDPALGFGYHTLTNVLTADGVEVMDNAFDEYPWWND